MFYFYILQLAFLGAGIYTFVVGIIFNRGTMLDYTLNAACLILGFCVVWKMNPVFWELVEKYKDKWRKK
ncbi:hypothetical protein [Bacillus phage BM-P1]|uniref:Uncharacterized protein n=1 Tax=Bacillus phage vB_BsuM-Goe3 TaxID=1933063 RepID=A0A1Z1DA17_BPGO3|nr:hypothetical protein HWB07_gp125 [Bacillus phage vB_BsuM-Goe3]APZ82645.1 hypothetical protein Goe3_c18400 [Bacillus phage vB_BsuM-Goe3]UJJ74738.1 hypothetical protein [Bacillus phage BM-P1]